MKIRNEARMGDDYKNFGQWIRNLASRSITESQRAAGRYTEWTQRLQRGELFDEASRGDYLRFVTEETSRYARDLMTLGLTYYTDVLKLGSTYSEHFFEQMLRDASEREAEVSLDATQASAAPPQRVVLDVHAPIGEEAVRSFVLENKNTTAKEISFLVSDFIGPAGTAPFRLNLNIQPSRFVLSPGEERAITLRLLLSPELFEPGHRYTATVLVRGYGELELDLQVRADAPEKPARARTSSRKKATEEPGAESPKPKRTRRKAQGGKPDG